MCVCVCVSGVQCGTLQSGCALLIEADGFAHSELALPRAEVDHNEAEPEDAVGVHRERDVLRLVEVLGHIAHLREVSCLTLYSVYCVERTRRERERECCFSYTTVL